MEPTEKKESIMEKGNKSKKLDIDYKKLEADLQQQIHEDEMYWLRNDAKLRACATAPTYEDFRQVVLAAHLKPVSKEDKEELERAVVKGQVIWNPTAKGQSETTFFGKNTNQKDENITATFPIDIPKTKTEFCKQWKALKVTNYEMKWIFLKKLLKTKVVQQSESSSISTAEEEQEPNTVEKVKEQEEEDEKEEDSSSKLELYLDVNNYENVFKKLCADEVPPDVFPDIIKCLFDIVHKMLPSDMIFRPDCTGLINTEKGGIEFDDWKYALVLLYLMSENKRHSLNLRFLTEDEMTKTQKIFTMINRRLCEEMQSVREIEGEVKILLDLFKITESKYNLHPNTPEQNIFRTDLL